MECLVLVGSIMIFIVQVHYRKLIEYEEEFYTASEAVLDFAEQEKKWKNKNAVLVLKDQDGNRILLRWMNKIKMYENKDRKAKRTSTRGCGKKGH